MRLKLTLRRPGAPIDLAVTADATATVADVAAALRDADPSRRTAAPAAPAALAEEAGHTVTLRVIDGANRVLDPAVSIAEAGLRSGSAVELVPTSRHFDVAGRGRGAAAAVLRVLDGPDSGREFPLPVGSTVVGRDRDADVRLADPLVSKRHVRVNVAESIEVIDLNSSNGVSVSGGDVARASLSAADVVAIGDTTFCVVPLQSSSVRAPGAPVVEHVRSPRVVPRYPGEAFPAPEPPKPPRRQRFPYLALAAPLVIGAVLFVLTQQVLSVVLMALSPVLLIGAYIDQSYSERRTLKAERRRFADSMSSTRDRLEREREIERRVRLAEAPSTEEFAEAALRLGPLLWTERPEHDGFLALHLGLGRAASRNRVELPSSNETLPDCWEELVQLRDEYAVVDGVPIIAELRSAGALGVAGPRPRVEAVARALVVQLVAKHSPAEVAVAAFVSPTTRTGWDWLKWTPHCGSAHSALEGSHLADSPAAAVSLLARLEGLIDARQNEPQARRGAIDLEQPEAPSAPSVPAVVVVVENDAPADRGRLTRVAERGADVGVYVIWVAPSLALLPAVCRSHVTVDDTSPAGVVGQVRLGERTMPVAVAEFAAERADVLARALAPVIDVGAPEDDDSDLPRQVSYGALVGRDVLDSPPTVVERWRENLSLTPRDGSAPVRRSRAGTLRALVGHAGTEPFFLDLRADGPHALVGGTTGSGKSEFLQAWVLGMAAAHSPDRLTFLFVDYKGGAAFADCVKLPHTVGLVTDLSPHLVRRALTSLRAELRYREHLLNRKGVPDLVTLEKSGDPECPPSLVIIVDEFAALVKEVPEFVDGVVDVAQRGRSLGLHLVLATQRPAGVIKDNLRANTNLRIALRMADADDSTDILGEPSAAHFDPSIPGRGAAKNGPGRIRAFQTGYGGGHTTTAPPPPRIDVEELVFGPGAAWELPEGEVVEAVDPGPTDIKRIVHTVVAASEQAGVPEPRKPWLAELAPIYNLALLQGPRTDERLLLGVLDEPETQSQPVAFYEPDRDGNLAVFGTGGSGKSALLRTLAASAALTLRGGPVHVYGLDFGSSGLRMLEELPHVGDIVSGDDDERVVRLLRTMRDLVDERAVRYAAVRAGSIGEYRRLADAPDEARILLLVDGVGTFRERYEYGSASASSWFTAFAQIAADGRAVGVHLVLTCDRPNSLPQSISSTVQRRIVLRMATAEEYSLLGVPSDILSPTSPPGRGILEDNEVQLALLGPDSNLAVQAREVSRLAQSMARRPAPRPARIPRLPERVRLDELPATLGSGLVVGLDDLSFGPAGIEPRGPLLIAGPPGSGRSTALDTLFAAVRRSDPKIRTVLFAPRRSRLSRRNEWERRAEGPADVSALAATLADELAGDQDGTTRLAVFVEGLTEFAGTEAEYDLDRVLQSALRADAFVVGEGETSTWNGPAYTLGQRLRSGRRGILLVPGDSDGDTLLGTPLGRLRRADFPPGRGFLVASGRASKVQIAEAEA